MDNGELNIVRVGIDTKDLGYAVYTSKDGECDLRLCSLCRSKKDAMELYYEIKAGNIGKKRKRYVKVVKIIADSWVEELANKFDPTGEGIPIFEFPSPKNDEIE